MKIVNSSLFISFPIIIYTWPPQPVAGGEHIAYRDILNEIMSFSSCPVKAEI
jgi:hypothetical protein